VVRIFDGRRRLETRGGRLVHEPESRKQVHVHLRNRPLRRARFFATTERQGAREEQAARCGIVESRYPS
jgi:hypothetical protein